jgi:C4-dicarboxylate transporter
MLPASVILVSLVWLVPFAGLFGMNPILSVSLLAPLLPEAHAMGVTPTAIIVALTAGWALSGASSPYTATTMLVGAMANVSAWHVGLKWNGGYFLLCALALSAWVLIMAFV